MSPWERFVAQLVADAQQRGQRVYRRDLLAGFDWIEDHRIVAADRPHYPRRDGAPHWQRMAEAKQGGCVRCGTFEHLHLHHVDPNSKQHEVGAMGACSDEQFWAEVAKCQVLCRGCHRQAHRELAQRDTPLTQ